MFCYRKYILAIAMLLSVLSLRGQVDVCYDFESATPDTRPMGWGALPNLDFHYVGVSSAIAHTGGKSLGNNGTTCYTLMPDEGINYGADGVWLTFWYYLHLNTDYFDVGYLTDAADSSTFHVLATVHGWHQEWHFFAVDLSSVPTGARIAFFGHDIFSNDGTYWLDDLHLTSSPCAAWGLRVAENRADSVRLEWQSAGSPTVTLTLNGTPHTVTGKSYTFARNANSSYTASLIASCPTTGCIPIQPYSEVTVYRFREGSCLDATDFHSSMAVPSYGTPVEPYLHHGTYTTTTPGISGIFAGSHTINTNPGSDGGGMMVFQRTIPPGDNATLRLGNRLGDWESASMLYTLDVDTNKSDLLVMKYTVAMAFGSFQGTEEAHHNDTLHPAWFRIELLDDTLGLVQPDGCNYFYIDMWDTAGWDNMNSMYKRRDFSGRTFDLSAYHGQRLHLRVTTTDGAVNNRWCYAYYNFDCLKRHDTLTSCTDGDSLTLTAPYGFLYRWWRTGESTTFSTEQSIDVQYDSTFWLCELTDLHCPGCRDTLVRLVMPRPFKMVYDTVVENALPHTWNGMTFYDDADTSYIIDGGPDCDTTVRYRLHVWHNQQVRLEQAVCPGDWPLVWDGHTFGGPDSISFTLTDSHGADSTVTLVAVDAPTYEVSDTVVICPWQPFLYLGKDYGGPCTFDTLLRSTHGCDSLVHVSLVPRDSAFHPLISYSTDSLTWIDSTPILLCENQTLHLRDSTPNATAWLWRFDSLPLATTSYTHYQPLADGHLTLIVTSGRHCLDTVTWPLILFPAPEAAFDWWHHHPIDILPTAHFINQTTPEGCLYTWLIPQDTEGGAYDTLHGDEPVYTWSGDLPRGNFDVQLIAWLTTTLDTLVHTCTDTATQTVEVVTSLLQFPNVVSPNGDGINDRWEVVNLVELGIYPMNELWIYDAWGMLVYHVRNIGNSGQWWDPNATRSPDGTYYYRFSAEGRNNLMVRRNGVIEVVR